MPRTGRLPAPAAVTALLLAVLTLTAFLPVRENGFVSLDDPAYITRNRQVLEGLGFSGARWAFTTFSAGNWHPLTWLSHMADVTLFGTRPGAHHLVSLALHALTTALLFQVLRRMTGSCGRSAVVAALFGVHPLHVESVAWAAERKDVLAGLFFVLTLAAYAAHLRRPRARTLLVLCTAFSLSLLAKPMAVTVPPLLLLLDFWPFGRMRSRRDVPTLVAEKALLLALAAASAAVTLVAQGKGGWIKPVDTYPLPSRAANALLSWVGYLRKTFWPWDLATPYGYPDDLSAGSALACLLLLAGVTALAVTARRRAPFLTVGWFWYLGMLVPVIGIVQVADQGMADRYTYLPLIGLFLALVWGIRLPLVNGGISRGAPALLAATVIAAGTALTWRQAGRWRDDITLFGHAVRVGPRNWLAHDNYGATLIEAGRYQEAAAVYGGLLRNGQVHPTVLNNLGVLAMYRGDYEEAEARLRQALALRPDYGRALSNLGSLRARQGRTAEAARYFEQAARPGGAADARRTPSRQRLPAGPAVD